MFMLFESMRNSYRRCNIKNYLLAIIGAAIVVCLSIVQFIHSDDGGYVLPKQPQPNIFISDISDDWTSVSVGFYIPTEHCKSYEITVPPLRYDVGQVGMDSAPVFRLSDKDSLWHNIDNLKNVSPENILDGLILYSSKNLHEKKYTKSSKHLVVQDMLSGSSYLSDINDCNSGNYIITKCPVGIMSVPQSNLSKDITLLKDLCDANEDDKWMIVSDKHYDMQNINNEQ